MDCWLVDCCVMGFFGDGFHTLYHRHTTAHVRPTSLLKNGGGLGLGFYVLRWVACANEAGSVRGKRDDWLALPGCPCLTELVGTDGLPMFD